MITTSLNTTNNTLTSLQQRKQQLLNWAKKFDFVTFLDSNEYSQDEYAQYEFLLAVANKTSNNHISTSNNPHKNSFDRLAAFHAKQQQWLFGYLAYDLKNELEQVYSNNYDGVHLPDMFFFVPDLVVALPKHTNKIEYHSIKQRTILPNFTDFTQGKSTIFNSPSFTKDAVSLKSRISKQAYIQKIKAIQQELQMGNIYEMNFCQEFYAEQVNINPLALFNRLNAIARTPFAAYLQYDNKYLLCASPERYLQKIGNRLISQPIKGSSKSSDTRQLKNSFKDITENVMIVDLVRNDLSRVAERGSVNTPSLFAPKQFNTISHLVSTVQANLRQDLAFSEALKCSFPMGSMTGAPKIKAMEIAEQYETSKRGAYSGAVGYITPEGNFDFNVVIRSWLYNAHKQYLSLQVGGAITINSEAAKEYHECLLKTQTAMQALAQLTKL